MLTALGKELYVENENMIDMATSLSATGPTYIFMVMEAMTDAGVHLGFSRDISKVDETREMRWTEYAIAMLLFSAVSMLVLYAMQRLQGALPAVSIDQDPQRLMPRLRGSYGRSCARHFLMLTT